MKKLLIALFIIASFIAKAQDTTVVNNFTMQAQIVVNMMPYLCQPDDSSKMNLYLKYNTSLNTLGNSITATTPITVNQISVINIVQMYLKIAGTPAGFTLLTPFQTGLNSYRSANTNLDRQCTSLEVNYVANKTQFFLALLKIGRGW